ncbi:MAG: class I SAM-dependent methyltransferase [Nitrospirota bacterium]
MSEIGPAELDEYGAKRAHYQIGDVAGRYDAERWTKGTRRWSNRRKFLAISKALALARRLGGPVQTALDCPTGTGRILPLLSAERLRFVGSDLSVEMMRQIRAKAFDGLPALRGLVRCDAERLPYRDSGFDVVLSIRFLFHLPTDVRRRIVTEMARVSREWLILDYRHKYTLKYALKRLKWRLGLAREEHRRVSRADIDADFRAAGIDLVKIFPTVPGLSDKWVILARKVSSCGSSSTNDTATF